jgi:hypothetical protein
LGRVAAGSTVNDKRHRQLARPAEEKGQTTAHPPVT